MSRANGGLLEIIANVLSTYMHRAKYVIFVALFSPYNHPVRVGAISLILQMKKLRFREGR